MSCPSPVKHKFLRLYRGVCHFHTLNPHYVRTTYCDPMARVREVCSAKASRRGVVAALIAESEARPLGGAVVESLGGVLCHPRKVEAPDALCAADHPWPRRRGRALWERRPAAIRSFAAVDKGDEEGDSAHKEATDGDPFAIAAVEGLPGPDGQATGQTSFLEETGLLEDAT